MFVTGISRVSRARKDSPLLSFMQPRSPSSFKTLVQLSRSSLFFKIARSTLSFVTFSGCRGLLSCSNFPLGAVDVVPTASARKTCLPRSTGSPFVPAHLLNNFLSFHCALFDFGDFVFLACKVFYTISFHTNPLAPRMLAAATAYTGSLGYTEAHLV